MDKKSPSLLRLLITIFNVLNIYSKLFVSASPHESRHWNQFIDNKRYYPSFYDYQSFRSPQIKNTTAASMSDMKEIEIDENTNNRSDDGQLSSNEEHESEGSNGPKTINSKPHCSLCDADFEITKNIRIHQIKELIYSKTGLNKRPNMNEFRLPMVPELMTMINKINEESNIQDSLNNRPFKMQRDQKIADSETIYLTSAKGPEFVKLPVNYKIFFFNLTEEHSSTSGVVLANLHAWLKPIERRSNSTIKAFISIYKIVPPKYENDFNRMVSFAQDIPMPYDASGSWIKIDIYSMIRDWMVSPEKNMGYVIRATSSDNRDIDISGLDDSAEYAPLLELEVREESNGRTKRYAGNRVCTEKKPDKNCCLYPLTMDFVKLELDFIVAPKKYVANFCRGKCPPLMLHSMGHSTLVQQMFPNSTDTNHGSCCGGSSMAPLKIVYFNGHRIKISTIHNMVVKGCSCN